MPSSRCVLKDELLRRSPCTSYPLSSSNSARYEPSWPVMPVTRARFTHSPCVRPNGTIAADRRSSRVIGTHHGLDHLANILSSYSTGVLHFPGARAPLSRIIHGDGLTQSISSPRAIPQPVAALSH